MADERERPASRPGFSMQRRALGGHIWAISVSYSGRPRAEAPARRRAILFWVYVLAACIGAWALLLIRALHGQAVDPLAVVFLAAAQGYALILNLLGRRA